MTITAADISALSRLLDDAMDLEPGRREAWLSALPHDVRHLAPTLRYMLAEQDSTRGPRLLGGPPMLADPAVAHAGDLVGPYRLLRELGQGGMGSVWLAERADGSFKRQVALKLPRMAWGAGLAQRMARERDIGARLEHPNIARLYDAGVDTQGRPYLAMEFVDGQPIDAWCEAHVPGVRGKLRLFLQVAHAVAYAHGRLVVHRDLKPSNVLVTADAQVRLLDFGIAKLLDDASPDARLTLQQGRAMTPHYASPEQVSGEAITVQSDVYGLGVLLHELLTGALPIAPKRRSPGALEDAILEGAAPPASSRVNDGPTARALRGELDAIVAKAIQREPERRYATTDALAQDIERHLAGKPVLARPDSAMYRLRKALRRHWLGVGAAAAVLSAVLAGSATAMVQAHRAERSAARERLVKDFITETFKLSEQGGTVNKDLRAVPAELLLERGAGLIESRFAGQTDLQAELYGVVAQIMLNMGAAKSAAQYADKHVQALAAAAAPPLQQAAGAALLGEALNDAGRFADATRSAKAAAELARGDPSLMVRSGLLLADMLTKNSQPTAALAELDRLEREGLLNSARPLPEQVRANLLRATALNSMDRFEEALPLLRKAIQLADAGGPAASRLGASARIQLADGLVLQLTRADMIRIRDGGPSAVSAASEAMQLHRTAFATLKGNGGVDAVAAAAAQAYATFLYAGNWMTNYDDADAAYAENLATVDAMGPRLPRLIRAKILINRGCTAHLFGKVQVGYDWMTESLALRRVEFPAATASSCLGFAAAATGRHEEAERILSAVAAKEAKDTALAQASTILALARNRLMQGNPTGATQALAGLLDRVQATLAGTPEYTGEARDTIVTQAWIDLERRAYAMVRQRLSAMPVAAGDRLNADRELVLGAALCASGEQRAGWPAMVARLDEHARITHPHSPLLAYWRARTAQCMLGGGEAGRARDLARLAREAFTAQPGVAPFFKAPLRDLEASLGLKVAAL